MLIFSFFLAFCLLSLDSPSRYAFEDHPKLILFLLLPYEKYHHDTKLALHLYSVCAWFEYRPRHCLSMLRSFVVFLGPVRQIAGHDYIARCIETVRQTRFRGKACTDRGFVCSAKGKIFNNMLYV
jgi:hypothetical protein